MQTKCVRGLDILKLQLFVLHNTCTMSFPLFSSRFLRYNKHYIGTIIQVDLLPPPRTLIMDFTLTHTRYGRSNLHPIGQLTYTRRSDGTPEHDGALKAGKRRREKKTKNKHTLKTL